MVFRLALGNLSIIPPSARPAPTTAPVNTRLPGFGDSVLTAGQPYTVDPGGWDGLPSPNYAYSIQRSGVEISTAASGTWSEADAGAGAGALTVEVIATNSVGPSAPAESAGVTIAPALNISGTPGAATVGVAYSFTPTITGGHGPYSVGFSGTHPSGITQNTSTGALGGTPVSTGTAAGLSMTVTDADGLTATLPYSLTVNSAGSSVLASVNGPSLSSGKYEGWSAEVSGDPAAAVGEEVTFTRPGYTVSGGAVTTTTHSEVVTVLGRVRKPAPLSLSGSLAYETSRVALSTWIYTGDSTSAVTNNSTTASPKPIACWGLPDRFVVGTQIGGSVCPVEVVALHRNGVAAVVFEVSDGTTTVTTDAVTTTTVSGQAFDRNAVLVYKMPLTSITGLNAGVLTVNAKVYPRLGGAGSVRNSADLSDRRAFSPRYFYKDTSRAANPFVAYVSSAGNDTTGVISQTPATAQASKFATPTGVMNRVNSQASMADGVIVYVEDGTFAFPGAAAAVTQNCAHITFMRAPTSTSRASVILTFSSSRPRLGANGSLDAPLTSGCMRIHDITVQRSGTGSFIGESIECFFHDFDLDANSTGNTFMSSSINARVGYWGMMLTNVPASPAILSATGVNGNCLAIRGVDCADYNSGGVDCYINLGNRIVEPGTHGITNAVSGQPYINAFNRLPSAGGLLFNVAGLDGAAYIQNVGEFRSATSNPIMRLSGDGASSSTSHILIWNNTFAGYDLWGRWNVGYDETSGVRRTHFLWSVKNNIINSWFIKGDLFHYEADGNPEGYTAGSPSEAIGNFALIHGCDCAYNFMVYRSNTALGGNEAQLYAGLGSDYNNTSQTVANDPDFVSYAGTTVGPVAGAGGGDYHLQAASPCRGMVAVALLTHDLDGNARAATNDDAGAYRYVA